MFSERLVNRLKGQSDRLQVDLRFGADERWLRVHAVAVRDGDSRAVRTSALTLIDNVVTTIEPLAVQNSVTLSAHAPKRPCPITTDETKLRQILLNLSGNACKFARNGNVRSKLSRTALG